MYRRRDVESVLRIKQLLYEQGFTIVGARQQLRSETKTEGQAAIPFPAHRRPRSNTSARACASLRHALDTAQGMPGVGSLGVGLGFPRFLYLRLGSRNPKDDATLAPGVPELAS